MVAEAEGREWAPPEPEAEAEPEPGPEPLSEAEFQEKLGRMVAESEGREYVPPEPATRAGAEADDQMAVYAEIHADLQDIGRMVREASDRMDAEAARRAEAQREILNEPSPWQQPQAQAEAAAEASWQPGEAVANDADADIEAEI